MRHHAATVVALLAAAGLLFSAFPAANAVDVAAAPTGVTIPKGYRNWQVVAPSQRDDKDEIRVILGNNIAMKAYQAKTLPFPDGAILAKSKTVFFRHNNPLDLERKMKGVKGKKLVVVEGVYSMDGDICTLPEILEVTKRHGARMLIDEAHSTFLFGPNGRGVAEHFEVDKDVDFHLGTFSKSLGGQGGFVAGTRELIDYVIAFARSRFFSCNLSPVLTAGLLAGLRIAASEPELRAKMWSNVAFLRRRFAEEGVDIGKSNSQVMPVMVNNDSRVLAVADP